ncbi:hypothetical protein [Sorangium sp. So ce128]|uniref:hypothetical protein n=1 Tax=Sorangium sp. So ce128 TaxID=3133281 RepID=UPI003F5E6248
MHRGVEEQQVLASRWINGERDLPDFLVRYQDWLHEPLDRCSRITIEALCPVA